MRKILTSHWFIGIAMLASLWGLYYSHNSHIEQLRLKTFDLYQQIRPRTPEPSKMAAPVVIVDIDDASLAQFGQWPWPRTLIANLVDNLTAYGVLVAGFDSVFAEPDRTSPDIIAQSLVGLPDSVTQSLKSLPSNEDVLAGSIRKGRVVLGQPGIDRETDLSTLTRKVRFGVRKPADAPEPLAYLSHYPGIVTNLKVLEDAASGIGLFSTRPDDDGIYRRVALVERAGDVIYPTLSLEMLRVALGGKDDYQINARRLGGVDTIVVRTGTPGQRFMIPTDPQGRIWVHYARYTTADPIYVSAKDVLMGKVDQPQKRLAGHLAVIGTSAAGLKDIRPTPINGALPGVEVHAQLLETILSQAYLTRPDTAILLEVGIILIGGLLMIALVPRLNAIYTFLLTVALIGGLIGIAWYYYTEKRELVDASYPALCIFLMFVTLSYLNYMREEQERKKVKTAFAHYVSPALLDQIAAHPEKLTLGGETRTITIMFSDIRGFTTISERFNAQELTRFINSYLTPMTHVIMNHKGTIDKYMGDAIMAFWNAPLDDADHAVNACRAALQMQQSVKELNEVLQKHAVEQSGSEMESRRHYVPIQIGVGLNSGPCCVGNMGSDQRFDYSALGDDVNLASRLEGQSKTYGADIVVGENTYQQVKDRFALIELDRIQVKGKTEPVTIYSLLGDETRKATAEFETLLQTVTALLCNYRAGRWEEAKKQVDALLQCGSEFKILATLYLDRIAEYQANPPPSGWNGVFIATSK